MKKFSFGIMALAVLIGGYFGSIFGVAIAIGICLTLDGLVEELQRNKSTKRMSVELKKEDKKDA